MESLFKAGSSRTRKPAGNLYPRSHGKSGCPSSSHGIAKACQIKQLQETLLGIALDGSDHQPTRAQAIRALQGDGDNTVRQLATLLATDLQEDEDDQIRGAVLSQVWPDFLSFEDLTPHLTEPKDGSFTRAYSIFLQYELAQRLRLADLPQALAWAGKQEDRRGTLSPLVAAADNIVKTACRNVDDPNILAPLSTLVAARLQNQHSLWNEDQFDESGKSNPLQDVRKRQLLIHALVECSADAQALGMLRIIRSFQEDDLSWLLKQALTAPTGVEQQKWSLLVQELFLTDISRYWAPVLQACLQNASLKEALSYWFGPIALDSQEADSQRREWQWQRSKEASNAEKEGANALHSSTQQVDLAILKAEVGTGNAWERLACLLGDWQRREWDADIRKYRIWEELDESRREKVVQAAQLHILEGEVPGNGTMSFSFSSGEFASFRALFLAISESPAFCSRLSQEVVGKWTPIILKKPGLGDAEASPYAELLRLASQRAPDLVVQKISQAIDEQNQKVDNNVEPDLDAQLQECWNDQIELLLIDKLKAGEMKPGFSSYLMRTLLARSSEQAEKWALQLLGGPIPAELVDQERQLFVAHSLLFIGGDAWYTVWKRITDLTALQDSLAKQTVNHLYDEFEQDRLINLAGSRLGEICAWLLRALPEPARSKTDLVAGWRGIAEVFRNQLFGHLRKAGSPGALQTLEHVTRLQPDDLGAKWMLAEAQQASLRQTWIPPTPEVILKMAHRPDARIVDSGEQLLAVILESLKRLQQKLHGHTPRVESLWNKCPADNCGERWLPKDEPHLSNYVKGHFDDDLVTRGIILNREVEIRSPRGRKVREGQKTDIMVDAIVRNPRSEEPQRISVIIEVKGCWNKHLKTAMKRDLVARYLSKGTCRHGLYLVGWFLCDAWDQEDYPKRQNTEVVSSESGGALWQASYRALPR